ncbi:MAG TPA: class I SAM-dependent methyltransferase [Gaiellaceae bacterium]|nr:class I SAM-dependent methyltransferase [Gaiellaceae bacterium]
MKETTERHSPDRIRTVEESVIDAMHRFAYGVVEEYARPTDRLLEIGFGEGYGSEIVRSWVSEYVGVEVDAAAVAHAAERYRHPKSTFLLYDGATLAFDDSSFDLVISFQVIEHVLDPERFLREAHRVARGRGIVLIVTPNRNHRLDEGERPWNRYHVREFSPHELETMMRYAFDAVEVFGIHGSATMNEIERNRVARARRLARLDPLGLRYHLPESIDTRLRTALRRRSGGESATLPPQVGAEHMYRTRDNTAASLDLLAVGRG